MSPNEMEEDEVKRPFMEDWKIFFGSGEPHDGIDRLPAPPPWRDFDGEVVEPRTLDDQASTGGSLSFAERTRGQTFQVNDDVVAMVNAALYLRRPLLITANCDARPSAASAERGRTRRAASLS